MERHETYTRDDVLQLGFEAICEESDGTTYLWHGSCGLRVGPDGSTVLLRDGRRLPDSPWLPTAWGEAELGSRVGRPDSTAPCESAVSLSAGR